MKELFERKARRSSFTNSQGPVKRLDRSSGVRQEINTSGSADISRTIVLLSGLLLVAYSAALFYGTLRPFVFRVDAWTVNPYTPNPEWIPFTYWEDRCGWPGFFKDKLFNIAIFLPVGALLGLILHRGSGQVRVLVWVTAVAFLCSLSIETLQYFVPKRHSTASDVLMNTTGGFLGAWLAVRALPWIRTLQAAARRVPDNNLLGAGSGKERRKAEN